MSQQTADRAKAQQIVDKLTLEQLADIHELLTGTRPRTWTEPRNESQAGRFADLQANEDRQVNENALRFVGLALRVLPVATARQ